MQTVIGAFDTHAQAVKAQQRLIRDGFDRDDVTIEPSDLTSEAVSGGGDKPQGRIGQFFAELFGAGDMHRHHSETYQEAVRRGSFLVVVDAEDDAHAEKAAVDLHEAGAINVDERVQQWRDEGWSGGQQLHGGQGQQRTLDVVEELDVGRRSLDRGGVRVVERTSERPLRDVVRLREEPALVERRPVMPGEMDLFREGALEVGEVAEEPVVARTPRVVEDRLRRKDDVQRLVGERERAVASNARDPLAHAREPDADRPLTGTRRRSNDPLQ